MLVEREFEALVEWQMARRVRDQVQLERQRFEAFCQEEEERRRRVLEGIDPEPPGAVLGLAAVGGGA